MSLQTIEQTQALKISFQMKAVLRIVTADTELYDLSLSYIDIRKDRIDWDALLALSLSLGQRAALNFAYVLWTDQLPTEGPFFEEALSMGPELRQACLKALAIRWNVKP